MHDYFLKFSSEGEANAVLFEGVERQNKYTAIDVIGTIYKPTGNTITTDDDTVPEMAAINGWHVNVRNKTEAPELDRFSVVVNTPVRVWA